MIWKTYIDKDYHDTFFLRTIPNMSWKNDIIRVMPLRYENVGVDYDVYIDDGQFFTFSCKNEKGISICFEI